uniref:NADH dehydrogenase subunit 4L n=1 Tax=Ophiactis savignyi TaxID=154024 RepID=UPI0021158F75|nr:NADH dehydrogenase subunit 4L [Ophiactis savignyi]USQ67423.1 NADH dehydrogenase subunit 4L [Ophiactis savignyi]
MNITQLIFLMVTLGAISTLYHNKFFLSILLSLELLLLNLITYNVYIAITTNNLEFSTFSIFILSLSAVEASIGISIIALLSRNFTESSITILNTLRN